MEHAPKCLSGASVPPFDFSLPEGESRALHMRLHNSHKITADVRDFPCKRAENKAVSSLGFIDKFFVNLAKFDAVLCFYSIKSLVGNRAACRDCEHSAVSVPLHALMKPVIENPWTHWQLPRMFIISRQHTEYRLDILPCNLPKIPCTRQNFHHIVQCITLKRRHRDKMLRQHVQTLYRRMNMLYTALSCKLCSHAAGDTLRRRPWKQVHDACPPRIVSSAP